LTAYWRSSERAGTPSGKVEFTYDRYGNITGVAQTVNGQPQSYVFNVGPATNRLLSRTRSGGTTNYSYDNAGNMTSMGTFDAENRLTSRSGTTYLHDGNGRRFRKQGTAVVNYVYSFSGQLLVEDNVTASTMDSMIYFNGQVVAIQGQQESSFKLFLKDRLGSTVQTYIVTLPNYDKTISESSGYDVWGSGSTTQYNPPYTDIKYQGKKRENDLDYFGARYYDALGLSSGSSLRWISADPVTSRVYDPQSLNKYTYVRNDPINYVDPDGRHPFRFPFPPPPPIPLGPDTTITVWGQLPGVAGIMGGGLAGAPLRRDRSTDNIDPKRGGVMDVLNVARGVNTEIDLNERNQILSDAKSGLSDRITGKCEKFINSIITALSGKISSSIHSASDLLAMARQNVHNDAYGAINALVPVRYRLGVHGSSFASTTGNTIFLGERFFDPTLSYSYSIIGGDPTSTLLHEFFHLSAAGANGKQIEDGDLNNKAGGDFGKSMRDNCGPKQ
jgi:RHS repeat-associated protein